MLQELLSQYPRLLEKHLQTLLELAEPNSDKIYELYKTCKVDGLTDLNQAQFKKELLNFYARPYHERRKSHFDFIMNRPLPGDIFSLFQLNFKTAEIKNEDIHRLSSWSYNLLRLSLKIDSPVLSFEMIEKTLNQLTHPEVGEKVENLTFEDFYLKWNSVVHAQYGSKYQTEIKNILSEFQKLDKESSSSIDVTDREIHEYDWVRNIRLSAFNNKDLSDYPFASGPQTQYMKELFRTAQLYRLSFHSKSKIIELKKESIRLTLLKKCDFYLYEFERFKQWGQKQSQ